ncbi:MAG: hypothetical protein M0R51_09910 [Clostridia bacterium]|jgi:hypothetical protein|nr:hypothetical protein [Clostridia bacterium]
METETRTGLEYYSYSHAAKRYVYIPPAEDIAEREIAFEAANRKVKTRK